MGCFSHGKQRVHTQQQRGAAQSPLAEEAHRHGTNSFQFRPRANCAVNPNWPWTDRGGIDRSRHRSAEVQSPWSGTVDSGGSVSALVAGVGTDQGVGREAAIVGPCCWLRFVPGSCNCVVLSRPSISLGGRGGGGGGGSNLVFYALSTITVLSEREREREREREKVTWWFTPSQPLRLYQGERDSVVTIRNVNIILH